MTVAKLPALIIHTSTVRPKRGARQHSAPTVTIADDDPPTGSQSTLTASADAYVRDGGDAGTNFGTATELVVKKSGTGFNREAYVRFDLSALAGNVTGARLRVNGKLQNNGGYRYPKHQTPWQEIQRGMVDQLSEGMVLKPAIKYRDVAHTQGIPRDNH